MKPIITFLSHADEDKKIARKLADRLKIHGFDVFVAHDDLGIGDEWEGALKLKIFESELFLVLLSESFHKANFTDHEIGIATSLNKRIFPVRIDDTMPYGFMARFQAKKISPDIDPEEISGLAQRLMSFTDEGKKVIDKLIDDLANSGSFKDANHVAKNLFKYTDFTSEQVNNIAEAFLSNLQIRGAWTSGPMCLEFFAKNWASIDKDHKIKLGKYYETD